MLAPLSLPNSSASGPRCAAQDRAASQAVAFPKPSPTLPPRRPLLQPEGRAGGGGGGGGGTQSSSPPSHHHHHHHRAKEKDDARAARPEGAAGSSLLNRFASGGKGKMKIAMRDYYTEASIFAWADSGEPITGNPQPKRSNASFDKNRELDPSIYKLALDIAQGKTRSWNATSAVRLTASAARRIEALCPLRRAPDTHDGGCQRAGSARV
mmetsp:Transcript_29382/g.92035  ORF Transcript_29382/g.92035 Transcript_29382/m.92035 type:complete len:210 (-) Transcript_29382:219-848(-)